MNLWTKDPSQITYADLDAFLQTRQPEGLRLDYKREKPRDLEKLIAAFANTSGGLIILGVEARQVDNTPVWPPERGMPESPGLDEAVTAVARDGIYPPVRIECSPVIPNERLHGHSLYVIRVDESREAPHAVEGGRKVYIRTGSTSKPLDLADIGRIRYLFDRRVKAEQERDQLVHETVRAYWSGFLDDLYPLCWSAVIPAYPWRQVCRTSRCYEFLAEIVRGSRVHGSAEAQIQRIPGGALARFHRRLSPESQMFAEVETTLVLDTGLVFDISTVRSMSYRTGSALYDHQERTEKQFEMPGFWNRIAERFNHARAFFAREDVEQPGLLQLTLGLMMVNGVRLYFPQRAITAAPYPKGDYKDRLFLTASEFLGGEAALSNLKNRLVYGFDLETPEGL